MDATVFRWNDWNLEHATRHGCSVEEIESVVRREIRHNRQRRQAEKKWYASGRGKGNRMIQVIFVLDTTDSLYVIHAIPLTTRRRR